MVRDGDEMSVRAIAMKHYSRQSSSYITQDEISSHLKSRLNSVSSNSVYRPDMVLEEVTQTTTTTLSVNTSKDDVFTSDDISISGRTSVPTFSNLATFKNANNIRLTINLAANDQGWERQVPNMTPHDQTI